MSTVAPFEVAGLVISEIDVRAMTDQEIAAGNEFGNKMAAESNPEDPPTPLDVAIAETRTLPDFLVVRLFRAVAPSGEVAASASINWTLTDENAHLAFVSIRVLPEFRRRGIAKGLLGMVVEAVEADNRSVIIGPTSDRVAAGEAFARRVGADPGLAMHTNRLELAAVDWDLVGRWVAEAPARAPGYSLVAVDGAYPDDIVEAVVDVLHVMNDAPRDALDMEDQQMTVEQMREFEKNAAASKSEHWSLFVRHDDSDRLVGLTDVWWNPAQPETVWQGNTGVRPEYRGHALGKWLKAVMLERILSERPEAKDIRTGNADSNDAMLAINRELGFKPYIANMNWQVSTEKVRDYLSGSSR